MQTTRDRRNGVLYRTVASCRLIGFEGICRIQEHCVSPKRLYRPTRLGDIITHRKTVWIFTTLKISAHILRKSWVNVRIDTEWVIWFYKKFSVETSNVSPCLNMCDVSGDKLVWSSEGNYYELFVALAIFFVLINRWRVRKSESAKGNFSLRLCLLFLAANTDRWNACHEPLYHFICF